MDFRFGESPLSLNLAAWQFASFDQLLDLIGGEVQVGCQLFQIEVLTGHGNAIPSCSAYRPPVGWG
jgi:hypothetical protein